MSDPVEMAKFYNRKAPTSWCSTISRQAWKNAACSRIFLRKVASEIFIPLTVGGINTLEDFDRVLKCQGGQG